VARLSKSHHLLIFDKKPPAQNNNVNYHQYVVRATLNDLTEIMMREAHCQADASIDNIQREGWRAILNSLGFFVSPSSTLCLYLLSPFLLNSHVLHCRPCAVALAGEVLADALGRVRRRIKVHLIPPCTDGIQRAVRPSQHGRARRGQALAKGRSCELGVGLDDRTLCWG
jgi:hypothetical protein